MKMKPKKQKATKRQNRIFACLTKNGPELAPKGVDSKSFEIVREEEDLAIIPNDMDALTFIVLMEYVATKFNAQGEALEKEDGKYAIGHVTPSLLKELSEDEENEENEEGQEGQEGEEDLDSLLDQYLGEEDPKKSQVLFQKMVNSKS